MTVKKDILDALWEKNDFWAKEVSRAQGELTLAQDAHVETYKKLEEAKHTVECYRSYHKRLLAAINTIEDYITND